MSSTPSLSVLITGSEITDGRVHDTNAHFIAGQAFDRSIKLDHILACDDSFDALKRSMQFLLETSTILIISGGLGPTSDDCTREALSELLELPLALDASALAHLESLYKSRQRRMDESNKKQALFPKGATIIANPVGTAAGFVIELKNYHGKDRIIFAAPGVPLELTRMFQDHILPHLVSFAGAYSKDSRHFLRLFGLPESTVGERVKSCNLPKEISVSYRAHFPEIQLLFKAPNTELLTPSMPEVERALGAEFIFSHDSEKSLEQVVHELLIDRKATISTAESCTAGLVSALLTATPGSSAYFLGGVLVYRNDVKISELTISPTIIESYGAVSHETAKAMAKATREKFASTYALSITGISGPGGGSKEKPVGTFFVGIASPDSVSSYHFFYPGERVRTRNFEAHMAIDVLRRTILQIPVREHAPRGPV